MGIVMNIYGVKGERLWGRKNLNMNVYGEWLSALGAFRYAPLSAVGQRKSVLK